jgi:hypothetical protein
MRIGFSSYETELSRTLLDSKNMAAEGYVTRIIGKRSGLVTAL